jgi:hypothetical protein
LSQNGPRKPAGPPPGPRYRVGGGGFSHARGSYSERRLLTAT